MSDLLARLKTILTADEIAYLALKPAPPAPPAPPASNDVIVSGVSNEYPAIDSFFCDCARMLLRYPNGQVGLFSAAGQFIRLLPQLNTSSNAVCHRTEPNSLYFVSGNSSRKLILGKDAASDGVLILRTFNEFVVTTPKPGERNGISTKGEQDLSDDGQFLAFCGTKPDGTEWVFRFDLKNQIVGPMIQIPLRKDPDDGLMKSAFDNIYMTPDSNILIGFYTRGANRFNGVELYDKNMTFVRQVTQYAAPHMDVLRDLKGDESVVMPDDAKPRPMMVRLADGLKTYFPEWGDWTQATHYSAPMNKGWFLVESYDPGLPDSQDPLNNAILRYGLDGTRTVLRKHGASAQDYEHQPKTSVSHDGSRYVYTVNGNAVIVRG